MEITRKDFVRLLVLGLGGTALACGGSDDDGSNGGGGGGAPADCAVDGAAAQSISGNHGHSLDVPAADFMTGTGGTYGIQGSADHSHSITLSGAQLTTIASGTPVTVTSTSGGGHTHSVVVACG
jgi:hypothetical protein